MWIPLGTLQGIGLRPAGPLEMQREVRTLRQDVHSIGIIICRNHGATHYKTKTINHNTAGNVWVGMGVVGGSRPGCRFGPPRDGRINGCVST